MKNNFTEILFLIMIIALAIAIIIMCVYLITDDGLDDINYLIYDDDDDDIRITFATDKIDFFYEEGGEYFWEYEGIGYSAPEDKIEFSGKE